MTSEPTQPTPYRVGTRFDALCRYPVTVDGATLIGYVSRWHREWDTLSSVGDHRVGRPPVGESGAEYAAKWLYDQYTAGTITPIEASSPGERRPYGPAPLLDHRLPNTSTNRKRAAEVHAELELYQWRPISGYSGSDNHMLLLCVMCGETVAMYWSHLRGRGGRPASAARHTGCLDEATVRRLNPAYTYAKKPARHPAPPALPAGITTRYSAGHILCEALAAAGHTATIQHEGDAPNVVVPLPGTAEVWITPDSITPGAVTLDYAPADHVHWRAAVRPDGASGDARHPICTPRPPTMAADVKRLIKAISQQAAKA